MDRARIVSLCSHLQRAPKIATYYAEANTPSLLVASTPQQETRPPRAPTLLAPMEIFTL